MSGPYPPQNAPQGQGGYSGPQHGGPGQGPGPGQWAQAPVYAAPRKPMALGRILMMVTAGLGLLNFIWGFLPAVSGGSSLYTFQLGWLTSLFFVAGLLAAVTLLPKAGASATVVAVLSFVGAVMALILIIVATNAGIGLILLLIFGLLQAAAAIIGWLYEAGILRSTPRPASGYQPAGPGYGQPAPSYAQPGGFPPGPQGPGPGNQPPQPQQQPQGPYQQSVPAAAPAPDAGSFGPQGGYAPQAQAAPITGASETSGGYRRPDDGDEGGRPDVTQQVRF